MLYLHGVPVKSIHTKEKTENLKNEGSPTKSTSSTLLKGLMNVRPLDV